MSLPGIDAVIAHVPDPDEMDTEPAEFTLHAVDDPADQVSAFAVVPPEADNDSVAPKAPVEVPEIVIGVCDALIPEIVVVAEVA